MKYKNNLQLFCFFLFINIKGFNESLVNIFTEWGENLDKEKVLQEYPRPQFSRGVYMILNGPWEYSLRDDDIEPTEYDGEIIVPFSIESPLSGVKGKSLKPGMTLWYKRIVDLTKIRNDGRFLLNFGAVDQFTEVFVNGKKVGEHDGGYTSFTFDITEYVGENLEEVVIIIKVIDNYSKDGAAFGKQGNPRGGIFYVQTGGIWQTVWIESVAKTYMKSVKITPLYDEHAVSFLPNVIGDQKLIGEIKIVTDEAEEIGIGELIPNMETIIKMPDDFISWSPENPYLYSVYYTYGDDHAYSYFGMRKFSIGLDKKNIKRLFLNNKPYFQKGLLDQGYWSDGYYTAPSDEAIIKDIQTMKDLGFNMLRKHIKKEPDRWYYHCDVIGMLVWQDQVSGGEFPFKARNQKSPDSDYEEYSRGSEIGRNNYMRDLFTTIDQLYNCPCISTWVPFNEAWGQFDSVKIANLIKGLDKTRFVDHASGWVDHRGPDFYSLHIYSETISFNKDKYGRPIVLSEYGGYGNIVEGHLGSDSQFAYKMFDSIKELNEGLKTLLEKQIIPNIEKGLCATVYTQVSDVEDEVNGLFTYDRKVLKADIDMLKEINSKIKFEDEDDDA